MISRKDRTVVGSCWTCKDRRIACDLTRPMCRKCSQTDRECSYDPVRLRWKDNQRRGRKRLRSHSTTSLQNVLKVDVDERHLSYFINELSPRLKIGSSTERVDIKSLFAQDAFRLVIIASSCTHQSMAYGSGGNSLARVQSIEAQQNAILALRTATAAHLSQDALRHTFQASALLCVINGMLDPCNGPVSFRSHLEGTKAILDRLAGPLRPLNQEIQPWTFFFSIFSTMELVNAILTGNRPLFSSESWKTFGSCYCWWGTVPEDDPFIQVLALFAQLATVAADAHDQQAQVDMGLLLTLHADIKLSPTVYRDDGLDEWDTFCAIYRNAALLFLYRAIAGLPLTHPLVCKAVTHNVTLIELLPRRARSCCLLPLLTLGLSCADHAVMDQVRVFLGDINNHLCFGAVGQVLECLTKYWQLVDQLADEGRLDTLDWWSGLPDIADYVCLF